MVRVSDASTGISYDIASAPDPFIRLSLYDEATASWTVIAESAWVTDPDLDTLVDDEGLEYRGSIVTWNDALAVVSAEQLKRPMRVEVLDRDDLDDDDLLGDVDAVLFPSISGASSWVQAGDVNVSFVIRNIY